MNSLFIVGKLDTFSSEIFEDGRFIIYRNDDRNARTCDPNLTAHLRWRRANGTIEFYWPNAPEHPVNIDSATIKACKDWLFNITDAVLLDQSDV